jgi:hypothetical protein
LKELYIALLRIAVLVFGAAQPTGLPLQYQQAALGSTKICFLGNIPARPSHARTIAARPAPAQRNAMNCTFRHPDDRIAGVAVQYSPHKKITL